MPTAWEWSEKFCAVQVEPSLLKQPYPLLEQRFTEPDLIRSGIGSAFRLRRFFFDRPRGGGAGSEADEECQCGGGKERAELCGPENRHGGHPFFLGLLLAGCAGLSGGASHTQCPTTMSWAVLTEVLSVPKIQPR